MKRKKLTIGWLYPQLMSTYGDRGNIMILRQRLKARGCTVEVVELTSTTAKKTKASVDLVIGGGAQDRQQEIVTREFKNQFGKELKAMLQGGIPGLFVCGSPQLLGHCYTTSSGQKLPGLGLFDMITTHPGVDTKRLIGNIVATISDAYKIPGLKFKETIVGFENHGGRTTLGAQAAPFARVVRGYGNNGDDGTEGVRVANTIGCYFHGPLLAKNPHIADWLITKSFEVKYGNSVQLSPIDDEYEWKAHRAIVKRYT